MPRVLGNSSVNTNTADALPLAIPFGISCPKGDAGYAHQTFLGASIRNFSINAGYGDSSTSLSVALVNDEFNRSDNTGLGLGDDPYHTGLGDKFRPPIVGSPVFFKFGKVKSSVNDAFLKTYDDIYGYGSSYGSPGQFHFAFGGILQSYVQNRGQDGNATFNVQVVDPREILSNVVLILNNYTGTIFAQKNIFNIYGFLEYNPTQILKDQLESYYSYKTILKKITDSDGKYSFTGDDMYHTMLDGSSYGFFVQQAQYQLASAAGVSSLPFRFPITGTGFSRRNSQGLPYYRLRQAMNALLQIDGELPQEYKSAGFGGYVNFRGYNYVIDFGGLPAIPDSYFLDFDQINLLDLCLEIADITSTSLFISLLPIIEHPVCARFNDWNNYKMQQGASQDIIAGIIRIDSIDKSKQQQYGSIKSYIESLSSLGIYTTNQDVGFELSNITTDKFISGAQEVDMYYFSTNADRDNLEIRKQQAGLPNKAEALIADQWRLETSLKQQVLPYYGLLGNRAITIPRGFGSYQQILLDSSQIDAIGVGNYYVATEMELRCALISFERWSEFLLSYNDIYMESIEENDAIEGAALLATPRSDGPKLPAAPNISNNYAVTVPRSVFTASDERYGPDRLPVDICNPPYGYPLYYKRATRIGIQAAGLAEIQSRFTNILTSIANVSNVNDVRFKEVINNEIEKFLTGTYGELTPAEQEYVDLLKYILSVGTIDQDVLGLLEQQQNNLAKIFTVTGRLAKKTKENSLKIYNFIRGIADECLGKKFLVKIPKEVNLYYLNNKQNGDDRFKIGIKNNNFFVNEYEYGPFGFRPRAINSNPTYEFSAYFQYLVDGQKVPSTYNTIQSFLTKLEPNPKIFHGALNVNYNPVSDQYEFNYMPESQGGFIEFDLFERVFKKNNLAISQGLVPQDLSKFINENSRLSSYVRFDHSEHLSLENINASEFSQQIILGDYFIPDLSESLDNTKPEDYKNFSFPKNLDTNNPKTPQVAFVKCNIDDKFYMPPKTYFKNTGLHGSIVKDIGKYAKPGKIYDPCLSPTGGYKNSFQYYQAHYVPLPYVGQNVKILDFLKYDSGALSGNIVTKTELLDTDHIYALITLPGRVIPTMDARFRDSTFQANNTDTIKHILTMDVVKIPEFQTPGFSTGDETSILKDYNSALDVGSVNNALAAYYKALQGLTFQNNRVNVTSPSPVYPDLVVLPLLSKERCYGPWVSSQLDNQAKIYYNVPGRIEFIKDENLAPWNYNGYQLMNQAGLLQAQFSNSLLLMSERGGFVVPEAPSGVFIGKALQRYGPLVTNIAVDVSDKGIQTTYKLDLYTSSFGKLAKQKEQMIANISRERQKIKDERNALVRKGIGKNQTNVNLNAIYNVIKNQSLSAPIPQTPYVPPSQSMFIFNSTPRNDDVWYVNNGNAVNNGYNGTNSYVIAGGRLTDQNQVLDGTAVAPESLYASNDYNNTAGAYISDIYTPISNQPNHPNMPSRNTYTNEFGIS